VSSCQDLVLPLACVPSDDDNADGSDIEDGETFADVGLEYDDGHQE
jgi:hypothetical protein